MTFDASIPLSSNSPALFPSQSQQNFQVLNTIVSKDHQFNNTPSGGDNSGYHNVIHMIQQTTPPVVSGTGQLYAKIASGVAQLFYSDGAGTEYQLTPQSVTEVTKITGTANVPGNGSQSVFNVAYNYTGYGTVLVNNTNTNSVSFFMRSGAATDTHRSDENGSSFPELFYSGTDLKVKNNSSSAKQIIWSLMVNKL